MPRQEIIELKNMTCVTSSLCKLEWFIFNWPAKGNQNGFPIAIVKIRVYKKLEEELLPVGTNTIQVDVSAIVIQSALNDLSNGETCPYNVTFSCAGKQWVPIRTIEVNAKSEEGWLELDLTPAVNHTWMSNASKSVIKVALKLHSAEKIPLRLVNPAMTTGSVVMHEELKSKQPHLLLFLEDDGGLKVNQTSAKGANLLSSRSRTSERRKRSAQTSCSLRAYTINFADINLDAILFPETVNVGICSGDCGFTFLSVNRKKGTNHALVMSRAFQQANSTATAGNSNSKPRPKGPCCVPVSYEGAVVIEADRSFNSYSLKVYPDFVATACSCR